MPEVHLGPIVSDVRGTGRSCPPSWRLRRPALPAARSRNLPPRRPSRGQRRGGTTRAPIADEEGKVVETRRLGRSGPEITTVGFGAWAAGGPWKVGWGPQSDADSIAAIRRSVERGCNWIDTAAVYGL